MAEETKVIEATCGPYRGQRLTMLAADAVRAIADKWARDPGEVFDPDEPPPEITTEQQAMAIQAARDWQQAQLNALENPPAAASKTAQPKATTAAPAGTYQTRSQ